MKRTRHLIAVALVATALCADRAVAAAPTVRAHRAVTESLASRLTTGFRRAVSPVRVYQPRQDTQSVAPLAASRINESAPIYLHEELSPFEFRLPPPAL